MLQYRTGDLFKSGADCLVNTVNCEGYMGKGIAYQFKMLYPLNNESYVKACKSRDLSVGKLHVFTEKGVTIVNFPTKDKWRAKSQMEYIASGLDALAGLIPSLKIASIAIPPLGSGNGGLNWNDVKPLIWEKLSPLSQELDIFVYEPSKSYKIQPTVAPKMNLSSLVLMQIKMHLNKEKYTKLGLQKTAFFMNLFLGQDYFKFVKHNYGPYDNSIVIVSKGIREFQIYYNVKDTKKAYEIAYHQLISENIESKMDGMLPAIEQAADFVNRIKDQHTLECLATIAFLIKNNGELSRDEIVNQFKSWSEDKAKRFSENEIREGIDDLLDNEVIVYSMTGYRLVHGKPSRKGDKSNI